MGHGVTHGAWGMGHRGGAWGYGPRGHGHGAWGMELGHEAHMGHQWCTWSAHDHDQDAIIL